MSLGYLRGLLKEALEALEEINEDPSAVNARLEILDDSIDSLEGAIDDLKRRVIASESTAWQYAKTGRVEELANRLQRLENAVAELSRQQQRPLTLPERGVRWEVPVYESITKANSPDETPT